MSSRSHETHSRRDLGLGGRTTVAPDEPGFDGQWKCVRLWSLDRAAVARRKCTVLHADTRAALHTVTAKRRRAGRAKTAKTGSRRRGTVRWRRSLLAQPVSRSSHIDKPLPLPGRHTYMGGRHSPTERGSGRLSQGSLVVQKGAWAICLLEFNEEENGFGARRTNS